MCGLIPDWNNYHDVENSVVRPGQMGPLWMEAHRASGMPMDFSIWHRQPPGSSFPACVAVKCVFLQSDNLGEQFLRAVRESIMIEGKDISRDEVLMNIAGKMSKNSRLDLSRFSAHYFGTEGKDAFRRDWLEARGLGIGRYPTIIMKGHAEGTMISGYRSFSSLCAALLHVAPHLSQRVGNNSVTEYRSFWGTLTPREEIEFQNPVDLRPEVTD
jgi:predicted DsbA family dithiol-disulfide isomerase